MKKFIFLLILLLSTLALVSCDKCEHQWSEPTCTTPKKCALCEETQGSPLGHEFGEWSVTIAPSCTANGEQTRTCKCGETERSPLPSAHTLIQHEGIPATCTAIGYKAYESCNNCNYTTYEEIPIAKHDTITHEAKKPTCTETGYAAYEECKNCSYTTYTELPVTKHDTVTFEAKAPTCTAIGYDAYEECKNCDYSTYKEKAMLDHNYVATVTPPTCEGEGYTTKVCSECGHTIITDKVSPHGHTWGEWFISSQPDENTNGLMRQNCVNCDKFNTKPLSVITSGNIGEGSTPASNLKYTLYEDGTLKITGSGKAYDCQWNGSRQPYIDYRNQVKRVIVCEGVTAYGRGMFAYMPNLEYTYIPTTVKEFPQNLFMDSFKSGITSFTIPQNITKIGICALGQYNKKNALFTEIIIENPNVTFGRSNDNSGTPYIFVNAYVSRCDNLTIYSYGANNNVKTYTNAYGLKYSDLNTTVTGEIDNLKYSVFNGELTLSALDSTKPVTLPEKAPWLDKLTKADVSKIVIKASITTIPAGYFKDYTSLNSVTLSEATTDIGTEAFACSTACSTALTVTAYDRIKSVSSDFLKNRTNVTVNGFDGTAFDGFEQNGVTLNLKKALKILLIGNSLSIDAADFLSANRQSQFYNIVKSMVGNDVYVQIGVLYSGAKTAGWHATVAESNAGVYTFYLISDSTGGKWKSFNEYSSADGLLYDNWDIVTIQPYASETTSGVGSKGDSDTKPEKTNPVKADKFYPLSASLPYLLDHVANYCPNADVYYYLTWSNSQSPILNDKLSNYNTMLEVAKNAVNYSGTNSGKGFTGLIPVGTAIQNARGTYLGLQYYVTDNDSQKNYFQYGLQRDNVHLSVTVGRYIAGLSFAEILVPQEYRLAEYTLPNIVNTDVCGELPESFTQLAQLCVQNMIASLTLTGNAQYAVNVPEGYETEPGAAIAAEIKSMTLNNITAADRAALIEAVKKQIEAIAPEGAVITVTASDSLTLNGTFTDYTVTVTVQYGYLNSSVTKTVRAKKG